MYDVVSKNRDYSLFYTVGLESTALINQGVFLAFTAISSGRQVKEETKIES